MSRHLLAPATIVQNAHVVSPLVPALGRYALALIFLIGGLGKLAAPEVTILYIASVGLPMPKLGLAIAVFVEIGGGVLLVFGCFTRPAAAVLAAFSLATAALFHSALGDQSQVIQLLKNIAIAGGLLQIITFGPGTFSIDALRSTPSR